MTQHLGGSGVFSGTLVELFLAVVLFTGGHFLLSSPLLRPRLTAGLGEGPFLGAYSLLMVTALLWLTISYARAPYLELWSPPLALRWLALLLMPAAAILVAGSLLQRNATLVGADPAGLPPGPLGITAITRHPFLWGVSLWALAHLLVNGDAASMLLFGGLLALSLGGTSAIDGKLRARRPEGWALLARRTSNLPLLALLSGRARLSPRRLLLPVAAGLLLFLALLTLHPRVFGVSPLPVGLMG